MVVSPARTARLLIALGLLNLGVVTAAVAMGPATGGNEPREPTLSSPTVIPLPTRPPGTPGATVGPTRTARPSPAATATPRTTRTPAPQTDTEP